MSPNRRIFLNIIATYGRSLYAAVCGLFSIRWVLKALGHDDFGLYGLIASLTIFISFFNNQFSGALSRFYAYSIGAGKIKGNGFDGLLDCRNWFTTGILIHTCMPLLLGAVGYVIGSYAITHAWLNIPNGRMDACLWLWRFVCISSLIGMINVPFSAMYIAKQYIAELTIYSFVQSTLKVIFCFWMTCVDREWLVPYGAMMCIISVVPQFIICARAMVVFPECHFTKVTIVNLGRIRQLASYAWWQTFGGIGYLCRHQCLEVIANKFFGPTANASYTVGAHVGSEAAALTGALNGAFTPVITSAYGAGDMHTFKKMAYRSCKFGMLLTLLFAIPLCLEIDKILCLWLGEPPVYAKGFCLTWLTVTVIEKLYAGHVIAVNATGRIAKFQFLHAIMCMVGLPIAVIFTLIGFNVYVICFALVISTVLSGGVDIVMARAIAGLSVRYLVAKILLPSCCLVFVSAFFGLIPRLMMETSFLRIVFTTLFAEAVLLPAAWFLVLDANERQYVQERIKWKFQLR